MSTRVAEMLDAYPLSGCVKIDDTLPGILEGLNAGMWTVGVTRSGNEVGLDEAVADALDSADMVNRIQNATKRFKSVGAHFVIDSVKDMPDVVADIEARMARGETPLHHTCG